MVSFLRMLFAAAAVLPILAATADADLVQVVSYSNFGSNTVTLSDPLGNPSTVSGSNLSMTLSQLALGGVTTPVNIPTTLTFSFSSLGPAVAFGPTFVEPLSGSFALSTLTNQLVLGSAGPMAVDLNANSGSLSFVFFGPNLYAGDPLFTSLYPGVGTLTTPSSFELTFKATNTVPKNSTTNSTTTTTTQSAATQTGSTSHSTTSGNVTTTITVKTFSYSTTKASTATTTTNNYSGTIGIDPATGHVAYDVHDAIGTKAIATTTVTPFTYTVTTTVTTNNVTHATNTTNVTSTPVAGTAHVTVGAAVLGSSSSDSYQELKATVTGGNAYASPVPEPASATLLGLGAICSAVGASRRRRQTGNV